MTSLELLRRARLIELRARRLVEDLFTGPYRSVFRGRGIEFDEVREYHPGDDVRSIDWHATARTGTVQVKHRVEERHLTLLLLVDVSASGDFGSGPQSKRELLAELAAVLALSAVRNNDRAGLLLFTDRVEGFLAPHAGRTQALNIVTSILTHRARSQRTSLQAALDALVNAFPRRATVGVLSDFLDEGFERSLAIAARRHDVVGIHVQDPAEAQMPSLGWLVCEDAETGALVELDTSSPTVRQALERERLARGARLRESFRRSGVDLISCRTDLPYHSALLRYFEQRHGPPIVPAFDA
jgi:uncharacterized protein (DUF58 family)